MSEEERLLQRLSEAIKQEDDIQAEIDFLRQSLDKAKTCRSYIAGKLYALGVINPYERLEREITPDHSD